MLDLSSRKVYGALAEQCVGGDAKADKVENATSGHLAGLDANGNLTDSGVSPTEDVTVEGNPVTFDSPFEQDAKSVVVRVKPIQAGSGTPSPDNIRPISGIDEVEIEVSGKNKLPLTVDGIKAANSGATWTGNSVTINGVTFTILTDSDGNVTGINADGTSGNTNTYLHLYRDTNIFSGMKINGSAEGSDYGKYNICFALLQDPWTTLVVLANDREVTINNDLPVDVYINIESGQTISNKVFYPMICLATENDPTFEPYNPNSHTTTIPLPSTLYDADVDVTEGSADSRKKLVVFDGSVDENISLISSNAGSRYAIAIPDDSVTWTAEGELSNMLSSNEFVETTNYDTYAGGIGIHYRTNGSHAVVCGMGASGINTVELFREWLANNPLQVCYELATPTTLSLTPTDVELLEGTNVVSTNAEKVAVTYGRSLWQDIDELKTDAEGLGTKAEISAIADSEPNATASQPYAVGGHFYKDGKFCTAIAQIASGATFTKGTNYVEGTIADNVPKKATFNITTSASGSSLIYNGNDINIIGICSDKSDTLIMPFISNNQWWAKVFWDNLDPVASTAVSGTYYYI